MLTTNEDATMKKRSFCFGLGTEGFARPVAYGPLILFVSVGYCCGCSDMRPPRDDIWKETCREFLDSEDPRNLDLEKLIYWRKRISAQLPTHIEDSLFNSVNSENESELVNVAVALLLAGGDILPDASATQRILHLLYESLDPGMQEETTYWIFRILFARNYQGDIEKILDALDGEFAISVSDLLFPMGILIQQDPLHPETCQYVFDLTCSSNEIVSRGALIAFEKLGCTGGENPCIDE